MNFLGFDKDGGNWKCRLVLELACLRLIIDYSKLLRTDEINQRRTTNVSY